VPREPIFHTSSIPSTEPALRLPFHSYSIRRGPGPTVTIMSRALPEYDYIFAFGLIFAFLDAWNIGANDVANSFATSGRNNPVPTRTLY
jgi:hypothetical protein